MGDPLLAVNVTAMMSEPRGSLRLCGGAEQGLLEGAVLLAGRVLLETALTTDELEGSSCLYALVAQGVIWQAGLPVDGERLRRESAALRDRESRDSLDVSNRVGYCCEGVDLHNVSWRCSRCASSFPP